MRVLRWVSLVAAALTVGCGTPVPSVDKVAEEKAIRDLDIQWEAAAAKKDVDAVVAFYAPDGTAVWPDAPASQGTAAVRTAWVELFKTPGLVLRFTPERIDVSDAGDMATDFGKVEIAFDGPQGRVEDVAKYLVVWRKVNGAWKVLYDSFNSNKPAAPAAPGAAAAASATPS